MKWRAWFDVIDVTPLVPPYENHRRKRIGASHASIEIELPRFLYRVAEWFTIRQTLRDWPPRLK